MNSFANVWGERGQVLVMWQDWVSCVHLPIICPAGRGIASRMEVLVLWSLGKGPRLSILNLMLTLEEFLPRTKEEIGGPGQSTQAMRALPSTSSTTALLATATLSSCSSSALSPPA